MQCFADNTDVPVKTGLDEEQAIYGAWIDGQMYKIEWEEIKHELQPHAKGTVTEQIEVLDNLYYSLNPKWVDEPNNQIKGTPEPGHVIDLVFIRPRYYESIKHEVYVGTGELEDVYVQPKYTLSQEDCYRGSVTICATVVTLQGTSEAKFYEWSFTAQARPEESEMEFWDEYDNTKWTEITGVCLKPIVEEGVLSLVAVPYQGKYLPDCDVTIKYRDGGQWGYMIINEPVIDGKFEHVQQVPESAYAFGRYYVIADDGECKSTLAYNLK